MRAGRRVGALTLAPALLLLVACVPRSQDQVLPETYVDPPAVSEEALAAYGEEAQEAYEEVADLLLEHATDEELVDPAHGTPTEAELTDDVVAMMTPEAAEHWRDSVAADLAGDEEARDVVRLLRFHTLESDLSAPRVGSIVRSQSVTDGTVDVAEGSGGAAASAATTDASSATADASAASSDTTDASATTADPASSGLEVTLTHRALLRLVAEGTPTDIAVERPLVLTLERVGDQWLIATFEGTLEVAETGAPDDSVVTSSDN